jgi:hypothetical protein
VEYSFLKIYWWSNELMYFPLTYGPDIFASSIFVYGSKDYDRKQRKIKEAGGKKVE